MKTILAVCLFAAVSHVSVEAQFGLSNLIPMPSLPSPSLTDYAKVLSTVTTIHSTLSKTPLRPFLPSATKMATDIFKLARTAKNAQDAVKKATDYMNSMVQKAAEAAKLPMESVSNLTNQMQGSFSQAMQNVGSAAPSVTSQN